MLLLFPLRSQVCTQEERKELKLSLGHQKLCDFNRKHNAFHPQSSFSTLLPATVISPQLVIELVCCDISLNSPGPDYSIFNAVCYAVPTVGRAIKAALPDQYRQSSKQYCLGIMTVQPEIHEKIVWIILCLCWLTVRLDLRQSTLLMVKTTGFL